MAVPTPRCTTTTMEIQLSLLSLYWSYWILDSVSFFFLWSNEQSIEGKDHEMNDPQTMMDPLYFEELRAQEREEKIQQERETFKEMFLMYDDNINNILSTNEKKLRLEEDCRVLEMMKEMIKLSKIHTLI
ncbi:unnamed protein product [Pleuronectes platessa]|uniref:Uncharacterized protein n=1 Tax=Pleuronectes platessa TaxID=8262 RepID=A0A9N7VCG0_PLEPL|nr:unnamed protein product [Pleuronectes platessa]